MPRTRPRGPQNAVGLRIGHEWRSASGRGGPSLRSLAGIAPSRQEERRGGHAREEFPDRVPGFTAAERAAMKQRAAELRAEGKKGAKKADELQAVRTRSQR